MIRIRRSEERGYADHGWLKARHTFSFADYHDASFMNFRSLRVINEDHIAGGMGFGRHPHQDMEIITYVINGALKHQDSMGHEGLIESGDVQKMTAGTGVTHSEFNASPKQEVHLLQIWITPQEKGLTPSYQQHDLPVDQENCLLPLPITVHQDVKIFRGRYGMGREFDYKIAQGRALWLQVIEGEFKIGSDILKEGDGASIEGIEKLTAQTLHQTEFLLFDLK